MLHTLVIFLFLFESRFSMRKTILITICTMLPLIILNTVLIFFIGADNFGALMLVTLTFPSLVVFFILSKYRDGRYFFTFCMVDTIVLETVYITNILNHYISPTTNIFLFASRLIIYPIFEIIIFHKFRPIFIEAQKNIKKGWGYFAIIGFLFYIAITLITTVPNLITNRPEQLPALVILYILMPIIYLFIITTIRNLSKMSEMAKQEYILTLQVSNLSARMGELTDANELFRVERHNFRHKLKTITSLIQTGQYEECLLLLSEYEEPLDKTKVKRYCQHTILDAVFAAYIQRALKEDITLDLGFAFPDVLPINEAELATAIANALENAITACVKLPKESRHIDVKVVEHPRFMIRISNSFDGNVEFDENNIPINLSKEHGFGTRFIAAFCDKNNGFYQFESKGNTFTLYLNF